MSEEDCGRCSHPFMPHIVVALGDPLEGGFLVCPVQECSCFSTWSVQGRPAPEVTEEMFALVAQVRKDMRET